MDSDHKQSMLAAAPVQTDTSTPGDQSTNQSESPTDNPYFHSYEVVSGTPAITPADSGRFGDIPSGRRFAVLIGVLIVAFGIIGRRQILGDPSGIVCYSSPFQTCVTQPIGTAYGWPAALVDTNYVGTSNAQIYGRVSLASGAVINIIVDGITVLIPGFLIGYMVNYLKPRTF